MRKEIKIAGLEKINAISEAAGGTVFRGHRVKEIETIVKILPYPVRTESKDDPGTITYLREIKRLKHLNHVPNIHVVKILNTGLTEKDLFPYIETELIKGSDLDDLLTLPNNAVFKLDQVIDLATQMADALAHCHSAMVKHGRINSNNIRLNAETGSYVLLNFGRVLLSD
ncbi:MAG TPA: protein kinase, partial [Daejeonella sp.]|nr:protein kinase [Daejeonella sp.]